MGMKDDSESSGSSTWKDGGEEETARGASLGAEDRSLPLTRRI